MSGLLSMLDNPGAQLGLGLLAAAGPSPVPMSFGQRAAGAIGQFQASQRAEREAQAAEAIRELQAQMLKAQMLERQQAMTERQQAQARQQTDSGILRNLAQGIPGDGMGPPTGRASLDPQAFFAAGGSLEGLDPLVRLNAALTPKQRELMTVAPGASLVDPRDPSRALFTAPKEQAADKPPTSVQEYEFAKAQGFRGSFEDWKKGNARAGATNITLPRIDVKTGEGIAAQVGPMLRQSQERASAGVRLVDSANRILEAAEANNLFAGPTANLRLKVAQTADVLGIAGSNTAEKITNTRNVVRGMAEQAVQARAQLGGQAQISNAEQELLNKATSGDIGELTAREIVQIAQLNDRLGRTLVASHQRQLERIRQREGLAELAELFEVPEPAPPRQRPQAGGLTPAEQQELQQLRQRFNRGQ